MLVTRQKVLRRFWYPVIPSDRLSDTPQPFTLLCTPLVLFRDAAGKACALSDRCCHRTARLSAGWLDHGNIVYAGSAKELAADEERVQALAGASAEEWHDDASRAATQR